MLAHHQIILFNNLLQVSIFTLYNQVAKYCFNHINFLLEVITTVILLAII
jgi:hypothetical protein